jgi:hypothetical protein
VILHLPVAGPRSMKHEGSLSPRNVLDISDAIQAAMKSLDMGGRYDVRWAGSRSTGYVGKPTGDDYEVIVTVKKLSEAD